MATEVKLPELAEGVEKGEVVSVLVSVGDQIEADAPLLELESEKATVTLPSPVGGTVSKVLVKPGQTVKVGETVVVLEGVDEPASDTPESAPAAEEKPEKTKKSKAKASDRKSVV